VGSLSAQIPTGEEHAARAAQLVEAGDLKGAEAEMRQAVELSPKEPFYLARLGLILGMQHRPKEANACFENALKLDPANLAIRRDLAASQWQMGHISAARESLELVLKVEPGDAQALLLLGMVYISAKRYAAALAVAQRASEALPSSYKVYATKGLAELRLQRYTDSEKSYQRAAELNPNAAEVNLGLALSQWAGGDVQQGFATFEEGLKRFPGDAYHCQEYGRLLLKSAKPKDSAAQTRAVALWQKAIALNSSLPEPHYLLGDLALQKGNAREAVRHLEQAVKLDPKESKIHFALCRAYRRLGRKEDAARELQAFQNLKAQEEAAPATPLLMGGLD
jgi:tetratricopeptide (TPR) repeat protein